MPLNNFILYIYKMALETYDYYTNGLAISICDQDISVDEFASIPKTKDVTIKEVEDYVAANYTFTRAFGREWQVLWVDPTQNEQVLRAAECDIEEFDRSAETITTLEGNLYTIRDQNVVNRLAYLTGWKYETEAWTSVSPTGEVLKATDTTDNEILFFSNSNGDNSVVTSVTVYANSVDISGSYTLNVDDWTLGRKGQSYIVVDWVQTWPITADYTYTPNANYKFGVYSGRSSKKYTIIKCETCPKVPESGWAAVSDVFYVIKAYISAPVTIAFPKGDEEPTPTPLNFATALWGDSTFQFAELG